MPPGVCPEQLDGSGCCWPRSLFDVVFVCYRCPKNLNTSMSYVLVLEARSLTGLTGLKLRCQPSCVPSRHSGGESIQCLSQLLEATCIPWLVAPSSNAKANNNTATTLCAFPPEPHLPLTKARSPPLERTFVMILGPHRSPHIISLS